MDGGVRRLGGRVQVHDDALATWRLKLEAIRLVTLSHRYPRWSRTVNILRDRSNHPRTEVSTWIRLPADKRKITHKR